MRYPCGSGLPTVTSSAATITEKQSRRLIASSIASISSRSAPRAPVRQGSLAPQAADKLFDAGQRAELSPADQVHHDLALAGHETQECPGWERDASGCVNMTKALPLSSNPINSR